MSSRYRSERCCPRCGSHDVARSRERGVSERLVHLVARLRPYRCRACSHRYFGYAGAVRAHPGADHETRAA